MVKTVFVSLAAVAALVAGSSVAHAQAANPVELKGTVKVDRLVTENGVARHVLLDPAKVVPGDHLVFATDYHAVGAKPIDHFVVTNPIPAGVTFADELTANETVSVDGGKTWGKLALLKVALPKGGSRAAQGEDVTHVRWVQPLLTPGATGSLTYKAVVR